LTSFWWQNHPIDFRGRLELDYPTITVTDMLLEEIQMWEAFSVKDLKDCLLLLKAHGVSQKPEKESVDASYIAKLLAQDGGFWYAATTNLKRIKAFLEKMDELALQANMDPKQVSLQNREEIAQKVDKILEAIDMKPKPFSWKTRAKIGTKKKWYNLVERPETVGGFGIWETLLKEKG
jgi:hypothetical protein